MSKKYKTYSKENNKSQVYYDFQGGYISYDPLRLTEHYTVKGFGDNIKNP